MQDFNITNELTRKFKSKSIVHHLVEILGAVVIAAVMFLPFVIYFWRM